MPAKNTTKMDVLKSISILRRWHIVKVCSVIYFFLQLSFVSAYTCTGVHSSNRVYRIVSSRLVSNIDSRRRRSCSAHQLATPSRLHCLTEIRGGVTDYDKDDNTQEVRVVREQIGSKVSHVVWDPKTMRFKTQNDREKMTRKADRMTLRVKEIRAFFKHYFIPEDVSPDYVSFTRWRVFQRFVAATVNVLGTKALLLALGIESKSIGAAAVTSWVLKDALGKIVRILWASKMGRRFDSDAKRWRYRSSLLYATGSGLEIITYVFPALFLILATFANALKQMSMLTSSATRNTIYRSFARGENIGDITAKGEAQIACTDLLGMLSGICLSRILGSSRISIGCAYMLLSSIDIFSIYNEIRSVVFTTLNYERASLIVQDHLSGVNFHQGEKKMHRTGCQEPFSTPSGISQRENIFLASAMKPTLFRTLSRTGIKADQVEILAHIFQGENYMLVFSERVGLSIVLRFGANGRDILRSLLALGHMEQSLRVSGLSQKHYLSSTDHIKKLENPKRSSLSWDQIVEATLSSQKYAVKEFEYFSNVLQTLGWNTDKFMFGNINRRSEWDIKL